MSAKGLIVKDSDANDARITIVRLSDTGREKVLQMQRDMYAQVNAVIDQVGIDKMMAFIALWEEIKSVLIPPVVKL